MADITVQIFAGRSNSLKINRLVVSVVEVSKNIGGIKGILIPELEECI